MSYAERVGQGILDQLEEAQAEVKRLRAVEKDLRARLEAGGKGYAALAEVLGERIDGEADLLPSVHGHRFSASMDLAADFVRAKPQHRERMLVHVAETLVRLLLQKLSKEVFDRGPAIPLPPPLRLHVFRPVWPKIPPLDFKASLETLRTAERVLEDRGQTDLAEQIRAFSDRFAAGDF